MTLNVSRSRLLLRGEADSMACVCFVSLHHGVYTEIPRKLSQLSAVPNPSGAVFQVWARRWLPDVGQTDQVPGSLKG